MDNNLFQTLCDKYAEGVPVKTLAQEAGISWQKLWGMLDRAGLMAHKEQPSRPQPSTKPVSMTAAVRDGDGIHRYTFDSVTEAVSDAMTDYAQSEDNRKQIAESMDEHLSGRNRWANNFTKSKFMRELSKPSKRLTDAVDRMRERLIGEVQTPTVARRRIRRGQDWGDDMDTDRWLVRDLTPWERSVREPQANRNVTIGCNLSVNSGVSADELLYRGAAALALADILSARGYNVGIVGFESCENPTAGVSRGVMRYTLKDHAMPLDINAVAFALCEIAWVRVVGVIGEMRHFPGNITPGWGRAAKLPEADRKGIDFLIENTVRSEEAAGEWLKAAAQQESEAKHVA